MSTMPWRSLRALSRALVSRRLDVIVEGDEHVPRSGPAVIAARHYHHLYDGALILATIPRPVHILVASDWTMPGPGRGALEAACRAAGWPVVQRAGAADPARPAASVGTRGDLLRAIRRGAGIVAGGGVLLVFPEGYPNVDPGFTPKAGPDAFLPFEAGFATIARVAAERTGRPVPVVPAGFHYQPGPRWRVALRFGEPITVPAATGAIVGATEQAVRHLSAPFETEAIATGRESWAAKIENDEGDLPTLHQSGRR